MTTRLICLLLVIALVSCDAQEAPEYRGVLYFGQDAYVMRFSLRDGSLSVAGRLGDTTIRGLDALGPDHLLVTETAVVNRQRVSRISWFDLKTGESADLYPGVLAGYLAEPGVIVYDEGSSLYAVPQLEDSANQVIFSHPQRPLTQLVEASPGTLLFETGEAGASVIHAWDARTGEVSRLDGLTAACRLQGAVWAETLRRLACRRRTAPPADAAYVLADLRGDVDGTLELPTDGRFLALTYIDSQHIMVLRETRPSLVGDRDRHAVWAYDVRTGASHRLAENVNLGQSVVYADF